MLLGSVSEGHPGAAKCPEPLCTSQVLPRSSWSQGPRQQVLPRLPRSYGLMRQSSPLLVPRWSPCTPGLCRLLSAPAGRRTFPTFSLRLCPYVLGPLPRWLLRCIYPFLPPRRRPSPHSDRVGAPQCSVQRLQYGAFFEAAVIRSCSGPQVCSPPRSLLPLRTMPHGSRGFSVRASRGSLPPHAPDMLAVRIGQLTAEDFHLIRCAALSAAPRTLRVRRGGKRTRSGRCTPSPARGG